MTAGSLFSLPFKAYISCWLDILTGKKDRPAERVDPECSAFSAFKMKCMCCLRSGAEARILPTMVTTLSKQDSLITMILASALNYVFLITPLALAKRYPVQSVIV